MQALGKGKQIEMRLTRAEGQPPGIGDAVLVEGVAIAEKIAAAANVGVW